MLICLLNRQSQPDCYYFQFETQVLQIVMQLVFDMNCPLMTGMFLMRNKTQLKVTDKLKMQSSVTVLGTSPDLCCQ